MDIDVVDAPDHHRFEARADDGSLAGVAAYRIDGGQLVFTHTEVDDAYEGKGVGSQLVRNVLDQLRDRETSVRSECSFINSWVEKHPEYQTVVGS